MVVQYTLLFIIVVVAMAAGFNFGCWFMRIRAYHALDQWADKLDEDVERMKAKKSEVPAPDISVRTWMSSCLRAVVNNRNIL